MAHWSAALVFIGLLSGSARAQAVLPLSGRVVVLDPGHGGPDAGATAHGLAEKDVVLPVAQHLAELLTRGGAKVVLTRSNHTDMVEPHFRGNRQRENLRRRAKLAEVHQPDCYVSIHANMFRASPRERGAQVFASRTASAEALKLAGHLMAALQQGTATRRRVNLDRDLFLFRHVKVPTVLVEIGFLSNPEEAQLLAQGTYRQHLARVLYQGMLAYFRGDPVPAKAWESGVPPAALRGGAGSPRTVGREAGAARASRGTESQRGVGSHGLSTGF